MDFQTRSFEIFYKLKELNVQITGILQDRE